MSEVKVKKTKLKAVNPAQPKAVILSEQNKTYLEFYAKKTRHSANKLLNLMVTFCRENDGLKNTPVHEPRSLAKAKEIVAKWENHATPTVATKKRASNS